MSKQKTDWGGLATAGVVGLVGWLIFRGRASGTTPTTQYLVGDRLVFTPLGVTWEITGIVTVGGNLCYRMTDVAGVYGVQLQQVAAVDHSQYWVQVA